MKAISLVPATAGWSPCFGMSAGGVLGGTLGLLFLQFAICKL